MKASRFALGGATALCRGALVVSFTVSALVLGLASPGSGQDKGKGNPNPGVLPGNSQAYGMTYGEWGAAWWQWALSIPADRNPLLDETGEFCDQEQSGQVWFLAGNFGGTTERRCTVPPGKALFFPLLNYIFVATEPGETEEIARNFVHAAIDQVSALTCTVDGVDLKILLTDEVDPKKPFSYRADSPAFTVELPEGNLFGIDPGEYGPSVADGYWIMLAPLSSGKHTIHFGGTIEDEDGNVLFELDVTYHLTVGK